MVTVIKRRQSIQSVELSPILVMSCHSASNQHPRLFFLPASLPRRFSLSLSLFISAVFLFFCRLPPSLSSFLSPLSLSLCCESCLLSEEGFFDKRSLCQPTHQRKPSSSSSSPFHSLSLLSSFSSPQISLSLYPSVPLSLFLPPIYTPHSFGALRALELQRDQLLLSSCFCFPSSSISSLSLFFISHSVSPCTAVSLSFSLPLLSFPSRFSLT